MSNPRRDYVYSGGILMDELDSDSQVGDSHPNSALDPEPSLTINF